MIDLPTLAQIGDERLTIPMHRRRRMCIDRIGLPIVDIAAGEGSIGPLRAKRVARGVAGAAMREPLDQIGAAIPFRTFVRRRPIRSVTQEEQLPTRNEPALIIRERHLVRARRRMHRLAGHQEGIERTVVLVGDVGEMVIGKRRVEMMSVAVHSRTHGAAERSFGPSTDAALGIWRDVGRENRAEWRRDREAAGKIAATAHRVAGAAVADRCQMASAPDQVRLKGRRRWRRHCCYSRPPYQRERATACDDEQHGRSACNDLRASHPVSGPPRPFVSTMIVRPAGATANITTS